MDAATPSAPDQPDTFVVLESRRRERALAVQKIQHAVPAFALLYAARRRLAPATGGAIAASR